MSLESRLNAPRERINIELYDSREFVLRSLSRGSVLVALTTLIALVFYHGFELEAFALNKSVMTPQRLIKILQAREIGRASCRERV